MSSLLIACGGFLAGILWMDLLFDAQIARTPAEQAVPVIAAYYENATINAYPMNRLIGLVMLITAGGAIVQLVRGRGDRRLAVVAAAAATVPVVLALTRVVPNAMRMGMRLGTIAQQVELAQAILFDHIVCLAMILAFIAIQLVAATKRPTHA